MSRADGKFWFLELLSFLFLVLLLDKNEIVIFEICETTICKHFCEKCLKITVAKHVLLIKLSDILCTTFIIQRSVFVYSSLTSVKEITSWELPPTLKTLFPHIFNNTDTRSYLYLKCVDFVHTFWRNVLFGEIRNVTRRHSPRHQHDHDDDFWQMGYVSSAIYFDKEGGEEERTCKVSSFSFFSLLSDFNHKKKVQQVQLKQEKRKGSCWNDISRPWTASAQTDLHSKLLIIFLFCFSFKQTVTFFEFMGLVKCQGAKVNIYFSSSFCVIHPFLLSLLPFSLRDFTPKHCFFLLITLTNQIKSQKLRRKIFSQERRNNGIKTFFPSCSRSVWSAYFSSRKIQQKV